MALFLETLKWLEKIIDGFARKPVGRVVEKGREESIQKRINTVSNKVRELLAWF